MKLILPIRVRAGVKKRKPYMFALNMNSYRNEHYMNLSIAKKNYHKIVRDNLPEMRLFVRGVRITYTLYKGDTRKCDVANVCSIVDKFVCDSLQKLGVLHEDNYTFVPEVVYRWGGIDKGNERIEVEIKHIN